MCPDHFYRWRGARTAGTCDLLLYHELPLTYAFAVIVEFGILFPHIYRGGTHRTCDTCGLCRKTDPVCSTAWLPLYTHPYQLLSREPSTREQQTRASDSRENRQKAFSLKLNWYIIFDKKIEVTNVQVPMLLVVSSTRKMNFPCTRSRLRTWSREAGCGSPVQRQPDYLHTQVESGAYLRDSSRVLRRRPFIYFSAVRHRGSPECNGHAIAYRWRSLPRVRRHRARKVQDSSKRALPWQVTMDQLMCASLSIGVPAYGQTGSEC